jgi:hypothetical protein
MTATKLWIWYAAGAAAALLWKFICYYRTNRKLGKHIAVTLDEWVFEKSPENAVSWIATILIVWTAGVTFIGDIAFLWSEFLNKIPHHPAFAALFGYIMEYAAPNAFKWILSKTPWATTT